MNLGNEITDLIGEEDIKQERIDEINSNIEEAIDIALTDIENMLGEIIEEMMDSMDGVISSDRARYVFDNIQNNEFSAKSVMAIDLHLFVDNYLGVEKYIRDGGEFLAKAALKDGANDLTKVASSSGSKLHKAVLKVGHIFGKKFKSGEALKLTNKIGKVASKIAPAMAAIDAALVVADKVSEELKIKKIREERQKAFNSISSIASEVIESIDNQYMKIEDEAFDTKARDVAKIRNEMIAEADDNREYVANLKSLNTCLFELISDIGQD